MINSKLAKQFPLIVGISLALFLILMFFLFSNKTALQQIKPAGLQVEYKQDQGNASVFLNDEFLEKAPLVDKNIRSGNYMLRIVPDDEGLAEYSTPISLKSGTMTVLIYWPGPNSKQSAAAIYELLPRPDLKKTAAVSFESYPENALLSLNGGETQYTPLIISDLTPGEHRFKASLPSYTPIENNIQVLAGFETKVSLTLAKQLESTLNTTEAELSEKKNPESTTSAALNDASIPMIAGPKVRIKSTNFFVDGEEVLRVRAGAGNNEAELGYAKVQTEYPYLGDLDSEASASASWYQIQFNDQAAWVSADYAELILPE